MIVAVDLTSMVLWKDRFFHGPIIGPGVPRSSREPAGLVRPSGQPWSPLRGSHSSSLDAKVLGEKQPPSNSTNGDAGASKDFLL